MAIGTFDTRRPLIPTSASAGDGRAGRGHRIAHVITQSAPFGGAQRNTLLSVVGLVRAGHEADLVCAPGGSMVSEATRAGVQAHLMRELVRPIDPPNDVRALVRLTRLFRARRYAVVHTHSVKAGVLGRLAARLAGVPVVVHTLHGVPFEIDGTPKSWFYTWLERSLGRATDAFVCVGEALRQEMLAWTIAPPEKLVTIYSGIDFTSYAPLRSARETKQALGLDDAWPIVLCVGRLCEQKAQEYLIDAVALLRAKYPRLALLLAGEGELRPLLEQRTNELEVGRHVSLLGERDDVPDLLNICDIYAMSSRWEGVGRALTEAMYRARPIVATRVNGVPEVIIDGETGLLVPPRDPGALAAGIDRLASEKVLARRLGARARTKAEELMDAGEMVAGLARLYAKLLTARPARRTPV